MIATRPVLALLLLAMQTQVSRAAVVRRAQEIVPAIKIEIPRCCLVQMDEEEKDGLKVSDRFSDQLLRVVYSVPKLSY